MSNFFVAFLLAVGVSGWIYSKMQHRSGGITQNSIIGATTVGLLVLIIVWSLLSFI